MKLNKNVIYRFESKILGGKTFIFNLDTEDVLVSDKMAFDILRLIDKEQTSMDDVLNKINSDYDHDITDKIYEFLNKLSNRKIILID